jgi:hypothetical protein
MGRTILEDMQQKTLENKHLFNKSVPLFTVAIPSKGKMSFISGFTELKRFIEELDPNTIDLTTREFEVFEDDKVTIKNIWVLMIDGNPVFMLRNNKIMNKGHFVVVLKRTGFANSF